jgi:tRNA A22 N-methylase
VTEKNSFSKAGLKERERAKEVDGRKTISLHVVVVVGVGGLTVPETAS